MKQPKNVAGQQQHQISIIIPNMSLPPNG